MSNSQDNKEIECRFLDIDKAALISKLRELGAKDLGENMLEETIIYDKEATWKTNGRLVRIRKTGDKTLLCYKHHSAHAVDGAIEIELEVGDAEKAEELFEKIGFKAWRHQQKLRHTFELGEITFDIDTWPRVPAYVELEGPSEEALKAAAIKLGFDWNDAIFNNAAWVIENKYNIPVREMAWFTFDRFE